MTSYVKNLFVPAAGVHWLTRFYDPALELLTRGPIWRPRLLDQVAPRPGERILDLGCGTGTLTVMVQQACAEADIIGLDIDRGALRIARRKATSAGIHISFRHGRADDQSIVPMFHFASFDKIVSSLFFHHLTRDQKLCSLRRARDLLRAGGEIHVADWGRPANPLMRILFYSVQALDGRSSTSDNVAGRLPEFMREVGFTGVTETHRVSTMLGTLCFYRGIRD